MVSSVLLNKKLKHYIYVFNGSEWVPGEYTDNTTFGELIINNIIPLENLSKNIVGFISYFKNKYMSFKTKKISTTHIPGSMCEQKLSGDIIKDLNLIENIYSIESLKAFNRLELCVFQEIKLRHFDHLNKYKENPTRWFLNPVSCLFISKMNIKTNKVEYFNIEQIKL